LKVAQPAAVELLRKFLASRESKETARQLKRLLENTDADDFRRMTAREGPDARAMSNYYLRRFDLSPTTTNVVESLLNAGPGFPEFRSHMAAQVEKYLGEEQKSLQIPLKNTVETFSGDQNSMPQYVANLLGHLAETSVLYLTEQRTPVGRAEAEKVLSFKVKRGGTESLKNIQQTVQGLLGVQVDAFESSAAGEKSAEMDVDNFLLEVNGSGIRESLRLILDVEFQHPTILLVEEPEVHLHPALETNMMRYLKGVSQNCQVFISTHSTNFLDNADMKNVYLVSKPQSFTEVQLLDVEDAESKIPKELGLRLSSLFMFDRLVFVEGPTDEAVLREWTSILGLNLSQANVGFVLMGGVRNFAHYATEATLSLLTKRQVGMWFIIDRDEREQDDVSKLESRLKNKAKIEVLSKRELENYLIVPRAIVEFIKVKQSMAKGPHPSPDEGGVVQAALECADELKQFAIAKSVAKKLCTPLYLSATLGPDDLQGGIEPKLSGQLETLRKGLEAKTASLQKTIEEKTNKIEGAWNQEKLDIVPGDLLLDRVCRRFGVRFKKDVDSARVAALMDESEIDARIKTLIREIAT
jgi:putative ATP-dependent endonuclease of the OLD family